MAAGLLVLVLAASPLARAQAEPSEAIRLEYDAPPECPTASEFFSEITGRTQRARAATDAEAGRRMRVRIDARDGALVGNLEVEAPDGAVARRALSAETCADLAAALALVAALSVDPHASLVKQPPPPPPPPPPLPPPAPTREAGPRPTPSAPRRAIVLGAGAQAGIFSAGDTGAIPTVRILGEATLDRDDAFAPSVRIALARTLIASIDDGGFGGRFTWTVGQIELCPVRFGRRLGGRPCLTSSAGALDAQGTTAPTTQQRTRPWFATGLAARLYAEVAPRLIVELQADMSVPWIREAFFFEPSLHVYRPPPLVETVQAGVEALFP